MVWIIAIDVVIAAALMAAWYLFSVRRNRQRSLRIVQAVKTAFAGEGQVTGFRWQAPSRFLVRLRLTPNLFRRAVVVVQMAPREMPLAWVWSWFRKRPETLTFEADLDCPPSFNLEVHNHRWTGRTRRFPKKKVYAFERSGPFVLTTRNDWQRDIMSMMTALVASRQCDFLTVTFRRTSPHFSATVALESFAQTPSSEVATVLRELAHTASAASF